MGGEGFLLCNEWSPKRAKILSRNIERMGVSNALVTNENTENLAKRFPEFFDRVLVDAPCSGEGMFRKEEQALTMWSQENVDLCAARQKEILTSAAKMLAPDGYLTYSTCTFAPEENEGVILDFLKAHPEFEVVEPQNPAVLACLAGGFLDRGNPAWIEGGEAYAEQIRKTVRLFPHHGSGEGHFAALLHKSADAEDRAPTAESRKEKRKGRDSGREKEKLTTEEAFRLYEAFLKDVTEERPDGVPCLFGEQLYLCPRDLPTPPQGLRILRQGLHLGSVAGGRFEPSHALALALNAVEAKKSFAVDLAAAQAYLHGDVLPCGEEKGWHLVTLDGFPLGWGKASTGMMKNHYPKGLRKTF
jgi:NOL1/NOP2/fmu family ribosome biogenesis protein